MGIEATPATEAASSLTEDQAVSELLNRWESKAKPKETPEEAPEETPEDPQPEQPQGDAPAEAETEETEEPGDTEIDVAGEKFKLPAALAEIAKRIEAKAKEVEAGSTRKFQEAADLRKAAEAQTQTAKQLQRISEAQADLLADHRMVARRLQQLEQIDIQNTDSETLTRLNAEYNQLQAAKTRIEGQYSQNVRGMQEEESKAFQAKREQADKLLSSKVKGWGPERAKALSEYALSKGAPANTLQGITDAWMVEILDDAAYGHAMRQAKPDVTKRLATTPAKTLQPGAAGNPKSAASAKLAAATAKARKTGRIDDAAALLLAKMEARGRRT